MPQNVLQHIHFPLPKRDLSLQVSNQVVLCGQGLLQEAVYSAQELSVYFTTIHAPTCMQTYSIYVWTHTVHTCVHNQMSHTHTHTTISSIACTHTICTHVINILVHHSRQAGTHKLAAGMSTTQKHECMLICTHTVTHTYSLTHTHTHTHTHVHTHTHTHTHTAHHVHYIEHSTLNNINSECFFY